MGDNPQESWPVFCLPGPVIEFDNRETSVSVDFQSVEEISAGSPPRLIRRAGNSAAFLKVKPLET
jgi:hypothetical protein